MTKTAVIVGAGGQDGRIATEYLLGKGYRILGIDQGMVEAKGLGWERPVDIKDHEAVTELLEKLRPDEVYYLAAFHHSSEDESISDIELFQSSYQVHVLSLLSFLEAIKSVSPETKLFYAASSLIFGDADTEVQDETIPFSPDSIYGITKLDGLTLCRYYRKKYDVFASVGILYNHESEYRSEKFISMKIVQAAIDIKEGKRSELVVGDLEAEVDWGYARDYIDAMHRILSADNADDFVIASGQKHSVKDLAAEAFSSLGLDWQEYVKEDKQILTRKRKALVGDFGKLKRVTGWEPATGFAEMVRLMIDYKSRK
ncbi:MAG: hypothetical protein A2808_01055 [Candidatus Moranbacteria bacterium RIFCSPHIGHO2_01_FULL_55_24]|nr:MAG: hypothetical protein A2808_01055 [Candidatus Moranbacteria bacterium RIFCSPHIGHO2_01_FULL_55_24]